MKSFIDFQKEETELDEEQLDELSKKTLGSYVNKAAKDAGRLGMVLHKGEWIHTVTTQPNRVKGIATAVGKLTKEESELDEEQLNEGDHFDKADHHWDLSNHHDELASSHAEQGDVKKELSHKIKAETHMGKYHDHMSKFQKSRGSDSGGSSEEHNKWSAASSKNKAKLQAKLDKMNEEVEQIDELSKDTLASYEKKSRVAAHKHALASELKGLAADPAGSYAHKMMADKRHAGWKVAVKKLNTEEVEQIDELSKDTLASYVNKSAKDVGERSHRPDHVKRLKGISVAVNKLSGYQHRDIELPTRKGNHLNRGDSEEEDSNDPRHDARNIDPSKLTKKSDLGSYVNKAAREISGTSYRPNHAEYLQGIRTAVKKLHTEEVELDETPKVDAGLSGREKKKAREARGTNGEWPPVGNTTGGQWRGKDSPSPYKDSGISKSGERKGLVKKSGIQRTKDEIKSRLNKEEVEIDEEQIEERNKQNAIMRKTMDASRGAKFKARNDTTTPDAEPQHKTAQAHNKAIGRAIRQMSNEEVEIKEAEMTDAEMAKREKIVKGMKKSFKDFTAKYGDRAKEVMYATATKKAMEEEVEEELEEDMDEGAVHKESYESHLANLHKVHQKSGNLEAAIKKVPTKHLQQIHYNNAERADHSVHPITKSAEKELKSRNVPLIEEDMDEGVTTRNGAITVHKGTYGTSYQPNDDEDDEDTPEKKEPAVKRGRGRPAGAKSGAKPKGSSAGKSYGGVAIHSLRLPNNNK